MCLLCLPCKKHFVHPNIYVLMPMLTCYIKGGKCSGHFGFLCLECLHLTLKKLEHISYSYSYDFNVSGDCMTSEIHYILSDKYFWILVTKARVASSMGLHCILHLHKHMIQLQLYFYPSWWDIVDVLKHIKNLDGYTSV